MKAFHTRGFWFRTERPYNIYPVEPWYHNYRRIPFLSVRLVIKH